jgi:hypothetical protein
MVPERDVVIPIGKSTLFLVEQVVKKRFQELYCQLIAILATIAANLAHPLFSTMHSS